MQRDDLTQRLADLLHVSQFKDYGPNGLQVEGKSDIVKVVTGVTACQALIDAAIDLDADAILVHHGLFWKGQDACVTGWMKNRLTALLGANINLYAYHLPLDAHPLLGNNAQLAELLGLVVETHFGEQNLGWIGHSKPDQPFQNMATLLQHLEQKLQHKILLLGKEINTPITRIAWCSGGAQSYFEDAIRAGAQVFISGEVSEQQYHYAKECGVTYLACGHHATERFGIKALGTYLQQTLNLTHTFIDIPNPV